ncbi:MAG TPA: class I SAM-dependent methyltransferase [Vicinamibacterales bacterium]|nr:class I SAM-dependent methyltransferase [Vicinamibacterales bacterium]
MGWDKYAPFYDWENSRTMGRRDLRFWEEFARGRGRTLELGCGTGRLLIPLARAGAAVAGVDLSSAMLERARVRARRLPLKRRPAMVRGDITRLPFADRSFARVFAPYGVLQSLLSDSAFDAALSDAARLLPPGGRFGIELIPELTSWRPYQRQVRFRGKLGGAHVMLVESVRQDRRRGLTIFDEEFTVRRGRSVTRRRFPLSFRSLPMESVLNRLDAAGFDVEAVQGSYRGGVWTPDSDVWIVTAVRRPEGRRLRQQK